MRVTSPHQACSHWALAILIVGAAAQFHPRVPRMSNVHMSLSEEGALLVSWSFWMTERMDEVVNPQLRFGKIRKDLSNVKNATNTTYWSGRMWCTVKLVGLDAGETYFYEVRLDFSELWGGFGRFIPPRPLLIPTESARTVNVQKREKNVVRLAMLGNLQMDEHSTSEIMGRLNAGPRIDIVFHLSNSSATADHTKVGRDDDRYEGDESDTDMGESLKALRFFSLIKPIATKKPFMTLPGNSDVLTTFLHHYAIPPYRKDPWYSFFFRACRCACYLD